MGWAQTKAFESADDLNIALHIQISEYFKIFDYWINLSYPSYFYFVT